MAKVKRDLRVLGAQRLECFDSTAWNRYYSINFVFVFAIVFVFVFVFVFVLDSSKQCWTTILAYTMHDEPKVVCSSTLGAKAAVSLGLVAGEASL